MLSLLAWAYIRRYATEPSFEPEHSNDDVSGKSLEQQHDFLDVLIGTQRGTRHHVATVQDNRSHQYWYNDTANAASRRVNLTSFRHIPLSAARVGVKRNSVPDLEGEIGVVNLNHYNCCATANEGRPSSIMRFGDNSSNLLITEQSANVVEVSAGSTTSGGQVSSLVDQVASAAAVAAGASETNINDSVVGVVGCPSGVGGAEDAFSMNITPALSQVSMVRWVGCAHGVSDVVVKPFFIRIKHEFLSEGIRFFLHHLEGVPVFCDITT